jgi:hypothetical protein
LSSCTTIRWIKSIIGSSKVPSNKAWILSLCIHPCTGWNIKKYVPCYRKKWAMNKCITIWLDGVIYDSRTSSYRANMLNKSTKKWNVLTNDSKFTLPQQSFFGLQIQHRNNLWWQPAGVLILGNVHWHWNLQY